MGNFILFCFLLWLIYNGLNSFGIIDWYNNKISIKELPKPITPIESSQETFNLTSLVKFEKPLPETEGGWLSINKDNNLLKTYASEIDLHRSVAERAATSSIKKFEADNKLLVDQQLQILRRAYQAKIFINRFKDLKSSNPSLNSLPKSLQIKLPIIPAYVTPEKLEKQYGLLPANTGHALGKLVLTNGGLGNSANLAAMAVTAAVIAVRAKSNISKLYRVLESAKGSVSNYCTSLNTTVSLLAQSHKEIVIVSLQLIMAELELISIIDEVKKIPSNVNKISSLDDTMKSKVQSLYFLILQSEQYGKRKI